MLPEISLFAHFKNKPDFQYEVEAYSSNVLFILKSGRFEFLNSDGQTQTVTEGEAVFCPKGFHFRRNVIFPVDLFMIKFDCLSRMPSKTVVTSADNRVFESLKKTQSAFCTAPNIDRLTEHYCIDACLEICSQLSEDSDQTVSKLPENVESFLNEHFTHNVTNDVLCELMHCSEATMIATFKKATKKTPQQFITEKRLKLARRLLTDTDENINIIAEKCGFSDPLYFSRAFKNHTHLTASEFRKKYRL